MEKFIGFAAEINGGYGIGWMSVCSHVHHQTAEAAEADRQAALRLNPRRSTRIVRYTEIARKPGWTEIKKTTFRSWNWDGSPA